MKIFIFCLFLALCLKTGTSLRWDLYSFLNTTDDFQFLDYEIFDIDADSHNEIVVLYRTSNDSMNVLHLDYWEMYYDGHIFDDKIKDTRTILYETSNPDFIYCKNFFVVSLDSVKTGKPDKEDIILCDKIHLINLDDGSYKAVEFKGYTVLGVADVNNNGYSMALTIKNNNNSTNNNSTNNNGTNNKGTNNKVSPGNVYLDLAWVDVFLNFSNHRGLTISFPEACMPRRDDMVIVHSYDPNMYIVYYCPYSDGNNTLFVINCRNSDSCTYRTFPITKFSDSIVDSKLYLLLDQKENTTLLAKLTLKNNNTEYQYINLFSEKNDLVFFDDMILDDIQDWQETEILLVGYTRDGKIKGVLESSLNNFNSSIENATLNIIFDETDYSGIKIVTDDRMSSFILVKDDGLMITKGFNTIERDLLTGLIIGFLPLLFWIRKLPVFGKQKKKSRLTYPETEDHDDTTTLNTFNFHFILLIAIMVSSSVSVDFIGFFVGLVLYPLEFTLLFKKKQIYRYIIVMFATLSVIASIIISFIPGIIFYEISIQFGNWLWVIMMVLYIGLIVAEIVLIKTKYIIIYWTVKLDLYKDEIFQFFFVLAFNLIAILMQLYGCLSCKLYDMQMVLILMNFGIFIAIIKDAKYRILLIILGASLAPILVLSEIISEIDYIQMAEYLPWNQYSSYWNIGYNIQLGGMIVYTITLIIFTVLIWIEA